ncbi:hypothetical protein CRUP_001100 [Coryphaenoides rupestris]|nr:hypothetical protein CRUP_001100 [Coryphaenoides rupestris]
MVWKSQACVRRMPPFPFPFPVFLVKTIQRGSTTASEDGVRAKEEEPMGEMEEEPVVEMEEEPVVELEEEPVGEEEPGGGYEPREFSVDIGGGDVVQGYGL